MVKSVCIIGGGISGLCTAFRLTKQGVDVTLFEKGERVGGNIRSEFADGFLIEHGPNSLLVTPQLVELIEELGLFDEIDNANPSARTRFVLREGKLAALPTRFIDIFSNRPISVSGKLRALREPFIRTRSTPNESVSEFFARRFGGEVVDYAVDPFVSGIFAGEPDRLSIKNAFPRLFELERDYGSVIKGFLQAPKNKSGTKAEGLTRTISFKGGLQTLIERLAAELGASVRLGCAIEHIRRTADGMFEVQGDGGFEIFDSVVDCTPAYNAAELLEPMDTAFSDRLASVEYPPISVVYTGFKKSDVRFDMDGFGFLVPGLEKRKILGSLWTSSVFAGRAPEGHHLMTTFIGGARNPELAKRSEDELIEIAVGEIGEVLGLQGEPVFTRVKKWERAIPQYNIGYENIVAAIDNFQQHNPGLFLCSNFYGGISVGDCVKNSLNTTRTVLEFIENDQQ